MSSLERDLVINRYGELWNYAERDQTIDALWALPDIQARLEAIIRDERADPQARFLACEVLFEREFTFVGNVGEDVVAAIYADALLNGRTGMANSWGLLWEHDDVGPVGARFMLLGEAAVDALRPLLTSNVTPLYLGSEEATVGNGYGFRVKDFAAYYIASIRRSALPFQADAGDRDVAIAALARDLVFDAGSY